MLASKDRLCLTPDTQNWLQEALAITGAQSLPLTPEIAVKSCALGEAFHGDPADRIIAATAMIHKATLSTADKQILACAAGIGLPTLPF